VVTIGIKYFSKISQHNILKPSFNIVNQTLKPFCYSVDSIYIIDLCPYSKGFGIVKYGVRKDGETGVVTIFVRQKRELIYYFH
jgi:hypothetical protein